MVVKLAQGIVVRILGETLCSLWTGNEGADDLEGTYARWLWEGTMFWGRSEGRSEGEGVLSRMEFEVVPPTKVGPLLRES